MSLRELLSTIWKRRVIVIVVLVFCLGISAVYAFSQPRKNYESGATIAFLPDPKRQEVSPPESLSTLLNTYAVVAQSEVTIEAAEGLLGQPLPGTVSATPGSDSSILGISSEAASGEEAAETVRAVTKALMTTIKRNGVVIPTVINPAFVSEEPIESRSPKLIIAIAAVLGLIAGVLLALLVENLTGAATVAPPPAQPDRHDGARATSPPA
jgi:capsular polysaccharide biosynthesis protein